MANNIRGTSQQGNITVPMNHIQLPSEALHSSRYQGCASDQSVNNTNPALPLGFKYETYDGRCFRFVENSTATAFVEGNVLSPLTLATMTAATTDATGLVITGTAPAATQYADQYRGGYAWINAGTGKGFSRRIVANSAGTTSTAGMTFTLERSIGASLSSLTIKIIHPWRVQLAPVVATNGTAGIVGVSYGAVPAQTGSGMFVGGGVSYFGWMQTRGICESVLLDVGGTLTGPAASALAGALIGPVTTAGKASPMANSGIANDDSWPWAKIYGAILTAADFDTHCMAQLYCE